MVVGALGAAASSLTANLVGQERVKQVGPTCGRIIRLGFAIELAATVIYVANVWYVVVWRQSSLAWCWSTEYFYNFMMMLFSYWYLRRKKLIF